MGAVLSSVSSGLHLQALADLLQRSEELGFERLTRQFLYFAWVCQQLAEGDVPSQSISRALAETADCVDVTELPEVLSAGQWDIPQLLKLLRHACQEIAEPEAPARRGIFVSLEGGDGSGKTTQTKALAELLQAGGQPAIATRILGGAPGGAEVLRAFILHPDYKWHSVAEALFTMAVYRETLAKTIIPALVQGKDVVCDRLIDTALVYFRDDAIGLNAAALREIYEIIVADIAPGLLPHVTFLLDLPYDEAIKRRDQRSTGRLDRNEGKGERFHKYVFEEYRRQAAQDSRIVVLDALQPADDITQQMKAYLFANFK